MGTRTIVDPWWRVLDAFSVCTMTSGGQIRGLRIDCTPTDTRTASQHILRRCRALRDALELVFLQSTADYRAFVEAILNRERDLLKRSAVENLVCDDAAFPRHVHIYGASQTMNPESMVWVRTAISTLLTPRPLNEPGQKPFQDARGKLFTRARAGISWKNLTISIGVQQEWMEELVDFVRTPPHSYTAAYAFAPVILDLRICSGSVSKQEHADIVTCLGDNHKRVRLGRASIYSDDGTDPASYGNLLAACFQPDGLSPLSHDSPKKNRRALMDLTTCANHRLLTQLCSAVMSAQGVESLVLGWTPNGGWFKDSPRDEVRFKRWVMLSLFSSLATHAICRLQLDKFYVTEADMDDLEAFLLCKKQLSVLRRGLLRRGKRVPGTSEVATPFRNQIFLVKGTKLWLNSFATRREVTRRCKNAELERECWADVVGNDPDDADFYEMLVPAYGWCKVSRVDAQGHRSLDQAQDGYRMVRRGITSLTLRWQPRNRAWWQAPPTDDPGLHRFLYLVGAPLEELVMSGVENYTPYLETVWAACPLLARLELSDASSDILEPIEDAYQCGKCHLSSLMLHRLRRWRGSADILQFCAKLCDPERHISKTLTKLSLGGSEADDEVAAMVQMLDCNVKLASFSVGLCRTRQAQLGARLRAGNNQFLPGQVVRLPMRSKLAFLSAVGWCCFAVAATIEGAAQGGIRLLNGDVIHWIFEMAASPVKRKVFVL